MKTVDVKRLGGTYDGRGIAYVFDCPYCKRGKDSSYSSALIPPEIMNHICDACGKEYMVKLKEIYDKMNDNLDKQVSI